MQTAEAAEDAELQILLSNPALRQPQTSATLEEKATLGTISGFQGFQEPIPDNGSRLAVTVTVTSPAISAAKSKAIEVGSQAASSMTDRADTSVMTDAAAESLGTTVNAEGSTAVAGKARGTWGAPKQPFIAAGKSTSSKETAAQLMSSDAVPAAVASSPESSSEVDTAVAEADLQIAAGLADSAQHEVATAESAATTSAADSLLPGNMAPEVPTAKQSLATPATDTTPAATSPGQHSADTQQAQHTQQHAQQAQHPQQHTQQWAQQAQHTQQDAQQALAIAEGGKQAAAKPAAGSYRRVAWAPVQNPFPAAGATAAAADAAPVIVSGATAAAAETAPVIVPSSRLGAEVADSPQAVRPQHASSCAESDQSLEPARDSAHQAKSSVTHELGVAQQPGLAQLSGLADGSDCTHNASGDETSEADDDAADDAVAVQMPPNGMVLQGVFTCTVDACLFI